MYELLVGRRPFRGSSSGDAEGLIEAVLTKRIDFKSDRYKAISPEGRDIPVSTARVPVTAPSGRDLMKRLLTKNANHRPTVDEALQHPVSSQGIK